MNYPGFTAELSLGRSKQTYHGKCTYGIIPQNLMPNQLETGEGSYEEGESDLIAEKELMGEEIDQEMTGEENGQDIGEENGQDIGEETGQDIGEETGQDIGEETGQDMGEETGQDMGEE